MRAAPTVWTCTIPEFRPTGGAARAVLPSKHQRVRRRRVRFPADDRLGFGEGLPGRWPRCAVPRAPRPRPGPGARSPPTARVPCRSSTYWPGAAPADRPPPLPPPGSDARRGPPVQRTRLSPRRFQEQPERAVELVQEHLGAADGGGVTGGQHPASADQRKRLTRLQREQRRQASLPQDVLSTCTTARRGSTPDPRRRSGLDRPPPSATGHRCPASRSTA